MKSAFAPIRQRVTICTEKVNLRLASFPHKKDPPKVLLTLLNSYLVNLVLVETVEECFSIKIFLKV